MGTCVIDSFEEIAYLNGVDDVDTMIKGATSLLGTLKKRSGETAVT
jgi:hypothetical protein